MMYWSGRRDGIKGLINMTQCVNNILYYVKRVGEMVDVRDGLNLVFAVDGRLTALTPCSIISSELNDVQQIFTSIQNRVFLVVTNTSVKLGVNNGRLLLLDVCDEIIKPRYCLFSNINRIHILYDDYYLSCELDSTLSKITKKRHEYPEGATFEKVIHFSIQDLVVLSNGRSYEIIKDQQPIQYIEDHNIDVYKKLVLYDDGDLCVDEKKGDNACILANNVSKFMTNNSDVCYLSNRVLYSLRVRKVTREGGRITAETKAVVEPIQDVDNFHMFHHNLYYVKNGSLISDRFEIKGNIILPIRCQFDRFLYQNTSRRMKRAN